MEDQMVESVLKRLFELERRMHGINTIDPVRDIKEAAIRAEYPQFSGGTCTIAAGRGKPGTLDGQILLVNGTRTVRATFDFATLSFKLLTDPALIEMLDRIDALDHKGE